MPTRPDFAPPEHAYLYPITVVASDIDELGHANNVVWVRWINEAAIAQSRSVGLDHEMYLRMHVIWVVRRHDIEYLSPALEGESLEALTWVADLRGATSRRRTVIRRDGRLLSRAETTWALVDTDTQKPRRIPEEMLARYGFSSRAGG
ncbi:MAG TPA: thioesterase family protein [Polyangiaceae bacterium]|jgi:acyl-CoA thioester hydrolase|nr:thioesterase family protein [Polyangiaceae bacterium]